MLAMFEGSLKFDNARYRLDFAGISGTCVAATDTVTSAAVPSVEQIKSEQVDANARISAGAHTNNDTKLSMESVSLLNTVSATNHYSSRYLSGCTQPPPINRVMQGAEL